MGQYDGFGFEDGNQNQQETGKALREARDAAAKEAKELKEQLAALQTQLTQRNLKDVLQEKSLNPGLAKWIAQDGIDGSDAAKVDEWLTQNAELIGYKPEDQKSLEGQPAPDARAAEFARMQSMQANALPAGQLSEAFAQIQGAEELSFADVNATLRQAAGLK